MIIELSLIVPGNNMKYLNIKGTIIQVKVIYQDRTVVSSNNERTTRVTVASSNTSNTTSTNISVLKNEGECGGADVITNNIQADVAEELVGTNATT